MKKLSIRYSLLKSIYGAMILVFFIGLFESCSKSSSYNNNPSPTPMPNQVVIQNFMFNPSSMSVAVNTTVTWLNNDGTTHTVTSNTGVFDSGNLAAGASFHFKFTDVGSFSYHCSIHPNMTGTVTVHQ